MRQGAHRSSTSKCAVLGVSGGDPCRLGAWEGGPAGSLIMEMIPNQEHLTPQTPGGLMAGGGQPLEVKVASLSSCPGTVLVLGSGPQTRGFPVGWGLQMIPDSLRCDNSVCTSGQDSQAVVPACGTRLPHNRRAGGVTVRCQDKPVGTGAGKNDIQWRIRTSGYVFHHYFIWGEGAGAEEGGCGGRNRG